MTYESEAIDGSYRNHIFDAQRFEIHERGINILSIEADWDNKDQSRND